MKNSIFYTLLLTSAALSSAADMADISGGTYRPLYLAADAPLTKVSSYKLDKLPVTNAQFFEFVKKNPQWQRGKLSSKQGDKHYLSHWIKDGNGFAPKKEDMNKPVVFISWFAANAYCTAQGKHLPTINQWEYAGQASELKPNGANEKAYKDTILNWYAQGSRQGLRDVGRMKPNYWGIYDMHGLIWEWTEDFNSSLLNSGGVDSAMFCSGAAAGATDPTNYAAFLRYGFRTSLQSKFSVHNLGFRCAQ